MRPRYLEIEGLQSFKELQRIDFDKLSETGLFGIFGPTGSGKSTILDAITLALYGSVQRAAKGTQGIINTDMGSSRVTFTFDLTKEGVRKTYRVERQYKRKKDSDSSAEAKLTRLFEIDGEEETILADKHSDVNNCVVQLLGLKFEDFTRSVVLPQNKFQEFLLSPRGEKTKMLERIFYLEEYGRQLGDKVNRQMSAVRYKLSNLDGALSGLVDASPEALIESERKMAEAQENRTACAKKLKETEESFTKGMELYKLSKEQQELQQRLEDYHAKQAEIQRLQDICSKSEAANNIKPVLTAYKEAKAGYQENNSALASLQEKLKTLEAEKANAEQKRAAAVKLKDEKLPEFIRNKMLLQECKTLQQDVEALNKQLDAARKEYEDIRNRIDTAKKTAASMSQQKDDLGREVAELEQKLEEQRVDNEHRRHVTQGLDLEKGLQSLEISLKKQTDKYNELQRKIAEYENQHYEALDILNKGMEELKALKDDIDRHEAARPMNREEIAEKQGKIVKLEGMLQSVSSVSEAVKLLQGRLQGYNNQLEGLKAEKNKIEASLQQTAARKDNKSELLKTLLQQLQQHTAALLARTLAEGEKCPVCGSNHHPHPAVEADGYNSSVEQQQKELQDSIEKEQKQIRELEHELIKLEQQQESLMQIAEQTSLELQGKQLEERKYKQNLPENLRTMEQQELQAYIMQQKEVLAHAAEEYAVWEQKQQQYSENLKQKESMLSETRVQESRLSGLLESTKTTLLQDRAQQLEQSRSYEEAAAEYLKMKEQLGADSFRQEAEKITEKDKQAQLLAAATKQKRSSLDALTSELQKTLENMNAINEILTAKKSEGLKLRGQKEEKEKRLIDVIGDKSLDAELDKVNRQIEELEASDKCSLEELNNVSGSLEEVKRRRAGLQSSFEYFKEKLEREDKRVEEALKSKGFADQAEVEACMLAEAERRQYQEEIDRYRREKGSLEDRLNNVRKQLGGKVLSEEQWQSICAEYKLIKDQLEQSISELEAAKNSYIQIKESFEKWVKLQEELKAVSRKKDLLEQIQKLLKGSAFIEFISEERMRYIAHEASVTLGELTKFRYSIELDSENGFVIRDNANGGVLRSVSSLSGGETFLTSLSLALALSSQLQLKGQSPLEFFFLDEGFGTLDNTLLDTVVDSLERLSSSKRVIGLISHVPEMKARIARRLIVEAPDRAGKGSRICIEKA